jgi:hypothetical protein
MHIFQQQDKNGGGGRKVISPTSFLCMYIFFEKRKKCVIHSALDLKMTAPPASLVFKYLV